MVGVEVLLVVNVVVVDKEAPSSVVVSVGASIGVGSVVGAWVAIRMIDMEPEHVRWGWFSVDLSRGNKLKRSKLHIKVSLE